MNQSTYYHKKNRISLKSKADIKFIWHIISESNILTPYELLYWCVLLTIDLHTSTMRIFYRREIRGFSEIN